MSSPKDSTCSPKKTELITKFKQKIDDRLLSCWACADKPWPPGRPTVTAMTRDSATLTWSPPRNDGGSPVTGYVVESKSSSYYAWTSCSVGVRIGEPHFVVPNLVDGTSYEFRVIAENRSGRSEPSPPSTPVVVRDVTGPYTGTRTSSAARPPAQCGLRHPGVMSRVGRLKDGNIHICLSSVSGYRTLINPSRPYENNLDITLC